MSYIDGCLPITLPVVPLNLQEHLTTLTQVELTDLETKAYCVALQMIGTLFDREKRTPTSGAAVFTRDGNIAIQRAPNDTHLAIVHRIAIYDMGAIRKKNYPRERIIIVFLEELCHLLWSITDELEVKHKVTEAYNTIWNGNLDIWDLYDKEGTQKAYNLDVD